MTPSIKIKKILFLKMQSKQWWDLVINFIEFDISDIFIKLIIYSKMASCGKGYPAFIHLKTPLS